jgi:hypothetical protein
MAALIWDQQAQAYREPTEEPKRYDTSSKAWTETTGKAYDTSSKAWTERWSPVAELEVGSTYTLGGNAKTNGTATPQAQCLAISGTSALMQSTGLWGGTWPGTGELSSTAETYFGNLSSAISNVYLPTGASANAETIYWGGSWTSSYASTVHLILRTAANNHSSFNISNNSYAWLGTVYNSEEAYSVYYTGSVSSNYTYRPFVCAPCFTLDLTKVSCKDAILTYKG